jgi:hypothetical protein
MADRLSSRCQWHRQRHHRTGDFIPDCDEVIVIARRDRASRPGRFEQTGQTGWVALSGNPVRAAIRAGVDPVDPCLEHGKS